MITDAELILAGLVTPQDIGSQGIGSTISENVYDTGPLATGNSGIDLGTGQPLYLWIRTDEAVTSAGAATLEFTLESDDAVGLDNTPVVHWSSGALAKDAFPLDTIGDYIVATIPPFGGSEGDGGDTWLQYVGLRYTVAVAALTAGKFTAGIMCATGAKSRSFASGMNFA